MSSHDTTMRTARALQLKPGTTLRQVFEAMDAFLTRHDLELHPMDDPEDLPSHGEVALNDSKGTVELSVEGELTFMLDALSPSLGIAPDQSDSLLHGIKALLAEGGAIELIDHDASPGNDDDAIIVFFIAPTEPQVRRAQIRYGMDKAAEWLRPLISGEHWSLMEALAFQQAPQVFVAVEDGQDGISTSVHLTRAGAEQALVDVAMDYSIDGKAPHTVESLREQLDQLRTAEERGCGEVISCGSIGTLWIDTEALKM